MSVNSIKAPRGPSDELYTAVAVILSWVYWLKGMRPGDEKN